jgi:hypothetical protein
MLSPSNKLKVSLQHYFKKVPALIQKKMFLTFLNSAYNKKIIVE